MSAPQNPPIFPTVAALRTWRRTLPAPVGFVPTMGSLHEGHLELVRAARAECKSVITSIFVNPSQFAKGEDYDVYPRPVESDLEKLRNLKVDGVFMPSAREMYFDTSPDMDDDNGTFVTVKGKSLQLEGSVRPHFFIGVATVVCKLFNIVQPDYAYFGQKDGQQCVVVRQMVRDLHMPLEVVVLPTAREHDGLAMSSRNVYLSPEQRAVAPILYKSLCAGQKAYNEGERDAEKIKAIVRDTLQSQEGISVQYVALSGLSCLAEVSHVPEEGAMLSSAISFGKVRILDNVILHKEDSGERFLGPKK
eukprot:Clim_evm31s11 gene=Clim_evmTU31s11